jgi:septum formation protein
VQNTSPRLVLASASPARRKTLRAAGIEPDVLVSGVDESAVMAERADELCGILARLKAEAAAARLRTDGAAAPETYVLGCDSVLEFGGEILGKPTDAADAVRRWQAMRGHAGILHTGHCLIDAATGQRAEEVAATTVQFGQLTDDEITEYVKTGEPLQVAGAFTIDGLGGPFVERIDGDPGTVIGLSLPLLRRLLAVFGVRIADLWARPEG